MDEDVPSPCIGICKMNPLTERCVGCSRTIDEIANWLTMTNEEKQKVIDDLLDD